MKVTGAFVFFLLISIVGHAKDHVIAIVGMGYPSPASVHLDLLQESLASKAVTVCGDRQSVLGLSDIKIQIQSGLNHGEGFDSSPYVATIMPKIDALDLWYPSFKATAVVSCK